MAEEGVDISNNVRTQLTKDMLQKYGKIISMAEPEFTPEWLSSDPKYTYWEVADPQGQDIAAAVEAKETIKAKIVELLI